MFTTNNHYFWNKESSLTLKPKIWIYALELCLHCFGFFLLTWWPSGKVCFELKAKNSTFSVSSQFALFWLPFTKPCMRWWVWPITTSTFHPFSRHILFPFFHSTQIWKDESFGYISQNTKFTGCEPHISVLLMRGKCLRQHKSKCLIHIMCNLPSPELLNN